MIEYKRKSYYDVESFPFNRVTRYEGEYIGRVIDVNDPYGSGAVKVHIPELMTGLPFNKGVWVNMIFNIEGQQSPPIINQMVIVTFRNGDPNLPEYRGILKFWDGANFQANAKTTDFPNEHPQPTSTQLDSVMYSSVGKSSRINKRKTTSEAASTYMPMMTPKKGHYDRFMDGKHTFIERKTKNGNSLTLCDDAPGGNYALLHAKGDNQFMASDHGYVEMSANNGTQAVLCDSKYKMVVVKSGKDMYTLFDDHTKAVFTISGLMPFMMRSSGNSSHILWNNPSDRFAPYTKVRSKVGGFGIASILSSLTHSGQGNSDMGGLGISKRGTGRATDYHLRPGFIFLNTF